MKKNFGQLVYDLFKTQRKYNYVDVGSSLPLNNFVNFFLDFCNIYLFEPNQKEFEKLKKIFKKKNFYLSNNAIGLKKYLTINLYSNKNLSSVFKVNNNLKVVHPSYEFIKKIKVKAIRIDQAVKSNLLTVLKIDAQGYGLECLQSAKKILTRVPIIIVEAEKYQMYKNQKLDFDIARFLHKNNYLQVGNLTDYKKSLDSSNRKYNSYFKEITYSSDVLYVKNFFIKKLSSEEYKILILFLTIFNYCDLAIYLLEKSNLNLFYKKKLKNIVLSKIKINKLNLEKNFKLAQQKKISLSKFFESLSWTSEISLFSRNI